MKRADKKQVMLLIRLPFEQFSKQEQGSTRNHDEDCVCSCVLLCYEEKRTFMEVCNGQDYKNGFEFMKYVNTGLIRKIDDPPDLKNKLIELSESKTHIEMSKYALLLGDHIIKVGGIETLKRLKNVL